MICGSGRAVIRGPAAGKAMTDTKTPVPQGPPIPEHIRRMAHIAKVLFVRVPHQEEDLKHPDPDYGL